MADPARTLERAKLLFGSIQAAEGTGETLAAGDVIRTQNLQRVVYDGSPTDRADDGLAGFDVSVQTQSHNTATFELEAAGSGTSTPDAAPPAGMDLMFRMAGYSATDAVGVSRTYILDPNPGNHEYATLRTARQFDYAEPIDCQASASFSTDSGIPIFSVTAKGQYSKPVNDASPLIDLADQASAPTYTNQARAGQMSREYDTNLQIDGNDVCLVGMSIDNLGFELVTDDTQTCRRIVLSRVVQTGTITILAPKISVKDFFALQVTDGSITEVEFSWTHDVVDVTNRFDATSSAIQIVPGIQEGATSGGYVSLELPVRFLQPIQWKFY